IVTFFPDRDGWKGPIAGLAASHEIAGHGIEMMDPLLYRMLIQAALLDAKASGAAWAPRSYGELNPAEFFATVIERYAAGDPTLPTERPNVFRLPNAIFNEDGARTDPQLYRRMFQGLMPLLLVAVLRKREAKGSPAGK